MEYNKCINCDLCTRLNYPDKYGTTTVYKHFNEPGLYCELYKIAIKIDKCPKDKSISDFEKCGGNMTTTDECIDWEEEKALIDMRAKPYNGLHLSPAPPGKIPHPKSDKLWEEGSTDKKQRELYKWIAGFKNMVFR